MPYATHAIIRRQPLSTRTKRALQSATQGTAQRPFRFYEAAAAKPRRTWRAGWLSRARVLYVRCGLSLWLRITRCTLSFNEAASRHETCRGNRSARITPYTLVLLLLVLNVHWVGELAVGLLTTNGITQYAQSESGKPMGLPDRHIPRTGRLVYLCHGLGNVTREGTPNRDGSKP